MNDIDTKASQPSPLSLPSSSPLSSPLPNTFVVKIGDEVQEKSGLKPNALSEEELVALFKTRNKKGKKTKN